MTKKLLQKYIITTGPGFSLLAIILQKTNKLLYCIKSYFSFEIIFGPVSLGFPTPSKVLPSISSDTESMAVSPENFVEVPTVPKVQSARSAVTAAHQALCTPGTPDTIGTSGTLRKLHRLVRRRPVDRRHRHVLQPQVHAHLPAVMDDVVHHEAAHDHGLRHREHFLALRL